MLINPNTATLSHHLCGLSAAQILLGLGGEEQQGWGRRGPVPVSSVPPHPTVAVPLCPASIPLSAELRVRTAIKSEPTSAAQSCGVDLGSAGIAERGGGRYAFITLQSLCGGRAPGDAALKRAFVPFPRFSKLLFAWLFICIKAEGGGVKISFSCQAQRFPFRVFPLPPPPPRLTASSAPPHQGHPPGCPPQPHFSPHY